MRLKLHIMGALLATATAPASAQGSEVDLFAYCTAAYLGAEQILYQTPVYSVRGYEFSDWRFRGFADYHEDLFNRYAKANLGPNVGAARCGFNRDRSVMEKFRAEERKESGGLRAVDVDYDRPRAPTPTAPKTSNRTTQ